MTSPTSSGGAPDLRELRDAFQRGSQQLQQRGATFLEQMGNNYSSRDITETDTPTWSFRDLADSARQTLNPPPISQAELPFYGGILAIGIFLSFFGHKLKKSVLFVTGCLLPVFLYTVNWTNDEVLKVIVVVVLGISAGIFFMKFPKCGLAGVGVVWGATMGRFLFFFLQSILKPEVIQANGEAINASCMVFTAAVGGLLLAGCFSKLYCLVIPFVGAVLGADSFAHVLIIVAHRYYRKIRPYFPVDTPLLIAPLTPSDPDSVRAYVSEIREAGDEIANQVKEFYHTLLGGGSGSGPASGAAAQVDVDDLGRMLIKYRYPWGAWVCFFLLCFIVGVKLQCREYKKEKKEKQKFHRADESSEDDEPLLAEPSYRGRRV